MKVLKSAERSFTLIETVIALGLMTFLILEVSSVQGTAVTLNEHARKMTQGIWLARRIMSQVEYYAAVKPFKEMTIELKDQKFEEETEFTYSLDIKDWKLPILEMLTGGKGDKEEGEGDSKSKSGGQGDMVKGAIEQILGDELLKVAFVEVFWPDGAARNSVTLTYLLTNQVKVDEVLATKKGVWDSYLKTLNPAPSGAPKPTPPPNPGR